MFLSTRIQANIGKRFNFIHKKMSQSKKVMSKATTEKKKKKRRKKKEDSSSYQVINTEFYRPNTKF